MTPDQILAHKPRVLTQQQREAYFADGYILLERILPNEWVEKLRATTTEMMNRSRSVTNSDAVWDLDTGHSAARPRLRRLSCPCDHHPTYWDYVSSAQSLFGDIAADLLGPDVKFHHSKLNFKASDGGAEVKWHQDIPFWPHTNFSVLTIGTLIYDCDMANGALGAIPGSHRRKIHYQFNDKGEWTGCLSADDIAELEPDRNAKYLEGPAGSLTIHHCRTVHGSAVNDSPTDRPLFLVTLSSSDAMPYTHNPLQSKYEHFHIRGKRAKFAHTDPTPCPLPPDWSGGYKSIFAYQQDEDKSEPIRAYAG